MKYLLDSVVVIDHLNAIQPATEFLRLHGELSAISIITRAEVLAGCSERQEAPVRSLLSHFQCLPLTVEIADFAAKLRRSERFKLPDAFQAAVAAHHDLTLVTRNTCDFHPDGPCRVVIPYRC